MKCGVQNRAVILRWFLLLGAISGVLPLSHAQTLVANSYLQYEGLPIGVLVVENDTMPVYMLNDVAIVQKIQFKNERQKHQYSKLVRDVKKTLPYARLCRDRVDEMAYNLTLIKSDKEKERYLKTAEQELFNEFEKPLRKLTFNQGRLLIKLVDRETGDTTFDLIKDLKGSFSAFVWQSVARMFGSNLKSEYNADGEDCKIESIIYLIDQGIY